MLTDRETQVVKYIARGWENNDIAYAMDISPKTVEAFLAKIKDKEQLSHLSMRAFTIWCYRYIREKDSATVS